MELKASSFIVCMLLFLSAVGATTQTVSENPDGVYCYISNCTNFVDGDWNTYSPSDNYIAINYTKPDNAVAATWVIKDGNRTRNFTIPHECLYSTYGFQTQNYTGILMLNVQGYPDDSVMYQCTVDIQPPGGGGGILLGSDGDPTNGRLYEEKVIWEINEPGPGPTVNIVAADDIEIQQYNSEGNENYGFIAKFDLAPLPSNTTSCPIVSNARFSGNINTMYTTMINNVLVSKSAQDWTDAWSTNQVKQLSFRMPTTKEWSSYVPGFTDMDVTNLVNDSLAKRERYLTLRFEDSLSPVTLITNIDNNQLAYGHPADWVNFEDSENNGGSGILPSLQINYAMGECQPYPVCPTCLVCPVETCKDTDGVDKYNKGAHSGKLSDGTKKDMVMDMCVWYVNGSYRDTKYCEGSSCRVRQYKCNNGILSADYNSQCPNGCYDGACFNFVMPKNITSVTLCNPAWNCTTVSVNSNTMFKQSGSSLNIKFGRWDVLKNFYNNLRRIVR